MASEFKVGDLVRTTCDMVDYYHDVHIPKGTAGVIVELAQYAGHVGEHLVSLPQGVIGIFERALEKM